MNKEPKDEPSPIDSDDVRIDKKVELLGEAAHRALNTILEKLSGAENAAAVVITVHSALDGLGGSVVATHTALTEECLDSLLENLMASRKKL